MLPSSEIAYVYRKKHSTVYKVHSYPQIQASIGSLEAYTLWIRGGGGLWYFYSKH